MAGALLPCNTTLCQKMVQQVNVTFIEAGESTQLFTKAACEKGSAPQGRLREIGLKRN